MLLVVRRFSDRRQVVGKVRGREPTHRVDAAAPGQLPYLLGLQHALDRLESRPSGARTAGKGGQAYKAPSMRASRRSAP